MSAFEFGDANAIVKVCLNRDGWEWFRDLALANLHPSDLYRRDIELADARLADDADDE